MEKVKDIDYDKWVQITVNSLKDALDKYGVGELNWTLYDSIMGEVVQSGGNVEKIVIKFLQYGRFVDMRVGRGVKLAAAKSGKRRKKPWFSKTKTAQISRLRELLIMNLSDKMIKEVSDLKTEVKIQL